MKGAAFADVFIVRIVGITDSFEIQTVIFLHSVCYELFLAFYGIQLFGVYPGEMYSSRSIMTALE